MQEREKLLTDLGFKDQSQQSLNFAGDIDAQADSFSGYGAYTPIKISTKTEISDAYMERGERRN